MNEGIREHELPERFATKEYQVLLVAEKYGIWCYVTRELLSLCWIGCGSVVLVRGGGVRNVNAQQ